MLLVLRPSLRSRAAGLRTAALLGLVVVVGARPAAGQEGVTGPRGYVTRAELERQAATASPEDAAAIRERLRTGDFQVGDRVVISTRSSMTLPAAVAEVLNDTLIVREGRTIRVPEVPDFSLVGVLRSEIEPRLNAHLKGYLRNVDVRVEPVVQANISGPVSRPGFTVLAPDMLLTDAIMAGGGINQNADVNRTTIRRDGEVVVDSDSIRVAIQQGATLDQIDFQTNDEIRVGERRDLNWRTVLGVFTALTSAAWLILQVTR